MKLFNQKELNNIVLFKNIPHNILNIFLTYAEIIHVKENDILINEGEHADCFFIISEGNFEVIKIDYETQQSHYIRSLTKGDIIGENSLIDLLPRSATVKAKTNGTLLSFSAKAIERFSQDHPEFYTEIIKNMAKIISSNLRVSNEMIAASLTARLQQAVLRVKMGNFLIVIISFLCAYAFILSFTFKLVRQYSTDLYASLLMLILILIPTFLIVKYENYKLSENGVNLINWKKHVIESFFYTLPILGVVVVIKLIIIHLIPDFQQDPLFNGSLIIHKHHALLLLTLYIASCPIQEFIARGILQNSLQKFLTYQSPLLAIVSSNLIYSTLHLYLSIYYAIVTFIPGLFFGWLYARQQQSLVGPIISHIMIGTWSIYILGVAILLK